MRLVPVAVVAGLIALGFAPGRGSDHTAPHVTAFSVSNGGPRYADDRRLLATISPDGDGHRDSALVRFRIDEPATVTVVVAAVQWRARTVFRRTLRLGRGRHAVRWRPPSRVQPRTYAVRLIARDRSGNVSRYGFDRPLATPVIRVLGIEAAFTRASYPPSSPAEMLLATDEPGLTVQVFRAGQERVRTRSNDAMNGAPLAAPQSLVLARQNTSRRLRIWVGEWPSGLYFAKLTAIDGRSGYAPFVVRPRTLGEHRVAVVLPTYTWQAYNYRDANGDGYGDTWYAGRTRKTLLGRPYLDRGVPPFFRVYDLNFLLWLARGQRAGDDRAVDFLADSDLGCGVTAAELAESYDLIVFPGHHEYVTRCEYDLVQRYRDRGGNLIFLSANNFFWRVDRRGRTLRRVRTWRRLGRPEAALLGVQYAISDRGRRKGAFIVRRSRHTYWVFAGTGLSPGSRFGRFGIEIDRTTRHSPRVTTVLADIPHLFGRGKTAQMTYYETPSGAGVFSAGAFTLAGYARYPPVSQILDNLWWRLARR